MIVTCFLEKRTPYKKELFAVCLVLLGVFFVATHGNVSGLVISHNAFVWGVIGSVSMLLYSMLPGNLLNAYGAGNVVGWAMLLNGIVLTFVVQPWKLSISLNEMTAIVLVFMVLFGTIVAFTLYLTGVAKNWCDACEYDCMCGTRCCYRDFCFMAGYPFYLYGSCWFF